MIIQMLLWSFASSVSEFVHHAGRLGRNGEEGLVIVFCNAHNKKLFKGFIKLAEENRIRLPSRIVVSVHLSSEIKACIQETEYRSTKFSVKELRNLGLFSERSAENWKRFNSFLVCSQS
jgi:singapore isolate B (sub-type 7) whole genome shotgun sequence assembly, scaffold_2